MLGKILLATGVVVVLFIVFLVVLGFLDGGGYPVGPLPDGDSIKLLCKKKKTAKVTSAKYTATADGKVTDTSANLQGVLTKLHGNDTYTVDSAELLGVSYKTPGSLKFTYTCD